MSPSDGSAPTPPRTRRAQQREATRARILEAARALVVEHGLEGTSMRAIAARVGCTPTAIYHHFRDKAALLEALCAVDSRAFAGDLARIADTADPLERIRQLATEYVGFALNIRLHDRNSIEAPTWHGTPCGDRSEIPRPERDVYELLVTTIEEALRKGVFRAEFQDAQQLAQIVWSEMHGLVALHMARAEAPWLDRADPRSTIRLAIDVILRGSRRAELG